MVVLVRVANESLALDAARVIIVSAVVPNVVKRCRRDAVRFARHGAVLLVATRKVEIADVFRLDVHAARHHRN